MQKTKSEQLLCN